MVRSPEKIRDYRLYYKFIENYASVGYQGINRSDALIMELEEMTVENRQYFFIADLLQGRIIFASNQCKEFLGIEPDELNPYHNIEAVHPNEIYRNTKGWGKLLNMAGKLLIAKEDPSILSVNMKMKNPEGIYSEILFQCFLFYSRIPHDTVYDLQILTNIDSIPIRKNSYHYYVGKNLSNFRYPDDELIKIGPPFTFRELEIIKLIEMGLSTKEIAKELFLSSNTVNTHRCNILKKTGKRNISDIIYDLKEQGII